MRVTKAIQSEIATMIATAAAARCELNAARYEHQRAVAAGEAPGGYASSPTKNRVIAAHTALHAVYDAAYAMRAKLEPYGKLTVVEHPEYSRVEFEPWSAVRKAQARRDHWNKLSRM